MNVEFERKFLVRDGRYDSFRLVAEPFGAWPEELRQAVARGRHRPGGAR